MQWFGFLLSWADVWLGVSLVAGYTLTLAIRKAKHYERTRRSLGRDLWR